MPWNATDFGYKVSGPDELMRAIARIGILNRSRKYVWRGVPDASYRMSSSLFRKLCSESGSSPGELEMRRCEIEILLQARQWGVSLELGESNTDLHLLASLQHHGVPTRLLDVTSNPMTALWFACQRAEGKWDSPGVLFAIDVTDMINVDSIDTHPGDRAWDSLPLGPSWGLEYALARSWVERRSFLLRPSMRDERMKAQEGMFVGGVALPSQDIPMVDDIPIGRVRPIGEQKFAALFAAEQRKTGRPASVPFCGLVISADVKKAMSYHLAGTYNRSRTVLFPDIDGFRDSVRAGDAPTPDEIPNAESAEEMAHKFGLKSR